MALFWVLRALYIEGGGGGSPQPPPVCSIHLDDATAAILHQNAQHTSVYWWSGDRGDNNVIDVSGGDNSVTLPRQKKCI